MAVAPASRLVDGAGETAAAAESVSSLTFEHASKAAGVSAAIFTLTLLGLFLTCLASLVEKRLLR